MGRISRIEDIAERLIGFISDVMTNSGYDRVVLGLSGGIDSAVAGVLAAKALGADNVLGMIMPYRTSSPESERDALDVAGKSGIPVEKIDLTPMIDAYFGTGDVSALRRGNKLARERMAILFDVAARDRRLVLGTSNKTEISLGYATWYGDAACSFNPLGGLYKHEVRALADYFGIARSIIAKNPTADLWPGQTDEGELGVSYDLADKVLFRIIEEGERSTARLLATGAGAATIRLIVGRINQYAYKRALPAVDLLDGRPVPTAVTLTEP
jgi:NAD+ synthase